jgi:hypothetical protein
MNFKNFNPMSDPKIGASQYEDSFPDVGREEMERRFSERRDLFLDIYDPKQPRKSLSHYMRAAQTHEGYRYKHPANTGPGSLFIGGSVPANPQKGELPECQLLGFVDEKRRVGCLATRWQRHLRAMMDEIRWDFSVIPAAAKALAVKRAGNSHT